MKKSRRQFLALTLAMSMMLPALPVTAAQAQEPTAVQQQQETAAYGAMLTYGSTVEDYDTLDQAIAALAGKTGQYHLTIGQNATRTSSITIPAGLNLTVDFAGKTVNWTFPQEAEDKTAFVVQTNGTLTLTNTGGEYVGGFTSNGEGVKNEGTVTISKGAYAADGILLRNENAGILTVEDGQLRSGQWVVLNKNNGYVHIQNGTLTAAGTKEVVYQTNGTMNITGGTFTSGAQTMAVTGGKLTLNGGEVISNGGTALLLCNTTAAAALEMTGGTLRGATALMFGADAQETTGTLRADIRGGTVTGTLQQGTLPEGAALTITGGTFSTDVTAYLGNNVTQIKTVDGLYLVKVYDDATAVADGAVAKTEANDKVQYYTTLSEALAGKPEKLTLLANTQEEAGISWQMEIEKNGFNAQNLTAGDGWVKTETATAYVFQPAQVIPEGTYTITPYLETLTQEEGQDRYTVAPEDQWIIGVTAAEVYTKLPQIEGFTFSGLEVLENQVVRANYDRQEYTVVFQSYDGTTVEEQTGKYGASIQTPAGPARRNYRFRGWNDGNQLIGANTAYEITGDAVLTASYRRRNDDDQGSPQYRPPRRDIVIADTEHGKVRTDVDQARQDDLVTITIRPDRGYELDNLRVTSGNNQVLKLKWEEENEATFTMPNSDVRIRATFTKLPDVPAEDDEETAWDNPFRDVDEKDWFYEAVQFVYENDLMEGTGRRTFEPNTAFTRAMIAQVLYNREDHPGFGITAFTDVDRHAWYANAINWAASIGLVEGYGDGTFGPNDPLTREQMAAVLYRYAAYKGYDTAISGNLNQFNDGWKCSAWATDNVRWAVKNRILNGMGNGQLVPQGAATRAEVATMLMQFEKAMA